MSQEYVNLDPTTKNDLQNGVKLATLFAPPLAFGALTTAFIGGLGLVAAITVAGAGAAALAAVPAAGKLLNSTKSLRQENIERKRILPGTKESGGEE